VTGVVLLLVVLVGATAFGVWRQRTDGRMRVVADAGIPRGIGDSGPADASLDLQDISDPEDLSEPLVVHGSELGPADHSIIPAAHALTSADIGDALGERATLVQFSSAFCQPCRVTRVVLGDVARAVPGVTHVEIDAESHLDLVRRVDVTRTPTVLVLDASGRIRARATGAPRSDEVIAALGAVL
jgi:thiol-disulfide isomerase/thioredoxin